MNAANVVPPVHSMKADTPTRRVDDALKALASNRDAGLSKADAAARLEKQGANEVPQKRSHPHPPVRQEVLGHLGVDDRADRACSRSFLHKRADFVGRAGAAGRQRVLSFFQEQRASAAVAALRSAAPGDGARAARRRPGSGVPRASSSPATSCACARATSCPPTSSSSTARCDVDQSALTGESREVDKKSRRRRSTPARSCATARRRRVVVATGARTYFGRTTQLVETRAPQAARRGGHRARGAVAVRSSSACWSAVTFVRSLAARRALRRHPAARARAADERRARGAAGDVHGEHGGRLDGARAQRACSSRG